MNNISLIKDVSGNYYAGMTIEQCKRLDCNVKVFQKIDKNKDNVLSVDEVILRRKQESKKYKLTGIGTLIVTALALLADVGIDSKTGIFGHFDKFDKFAIPTILLLGAGAIGYRAIKIDRETKRIPKRLNEQGLK